MGTIGMSGEVNAMAAIEAAFSALDDEAKGRVLRWAADRFGLSTQLKVQGAPSAVVPNSLSPSNGPIEAMELADVYSAAVPTTESEKALVVAYWLQVVRGQADLESLQINNELKQLGHGVGNITRALEVLKDQKPQLVVQTRKEGATKQARKKYRVTEEGRKLVQQMMTKVKEQ